MNKTAQEPEHTNLVWKGIVSSGPILPDILDCLIELNCEDWAGESIIEGFQRHVQMIPYVQLARASCL